MTINEDELTKEEAEKIYLKRKLPPTFTVKNDEALEDWQEGVKNNQDGYGFAIFTYANRYATAMEKAIEQGAKLKDIWEKLSYEYANDDDGEEITGHMYSYAIFLLSVAWKYGDELRVLHNIKNGSTPENEGVVDTAYLSVSF